MNPAPAGAGGKVTDLVHWDHCLRGNRNHSHVSWLGGPLDKKISVDAFLKFCADFFRRRWWILDRGSLRRGLDLTPAVASEVDMAWFATVSGSRCPFQRKVDRLKARARAIAASS